MQRNTRHQLSLSSFALLTMFCAASFAQPPNSSRPGLLAGLGIWKHPIATRNPDAQRYFDQGLVLIYSFNRPAALRSFRTAIELDPSAPMALWGVAMALGPYVNMDLDPEVQMKESCAAVESGLRLAGAGSAERAWLEAAGARCPDYKDPARYIAAMRSLALRFPDDPDAQTLFAESLLLPVRWAWYTADGKPAPGVEEAEHVLEAVMRRFPDHPGANHLYIHSVESSQTPERAVPSAQRLMGIVPAAGHMVHMPGHIWLVLGNYDAAADVNERAAQVDREYFAKTGDTNGYYMYYLHNLQFLMYARAMQGRAAETSKTIAEMRAAVVPMAKQMPEMAGVFDVSIGMTDLRIGRWDSVLATPQPPVNDHVSVAMWHYLRASALWAQGHAQEARAERQRFDQAAGSADRAMPWGNNKSGPVLDLAGASLAARFESDPHSAVAKWKQAVAIQDALVYDEPPAWYYPVRESLGAALLQAGNAPEAEAVFREGLRRSPNNGRMLFGLIESVKAQGKTDALPWLQQEFNRAWKGADVELRVNVL